MRRVAAAVDVPKPAAGRGGGQPAPRGGLNRPLYDYIPISRAEHEYIHIFLYIPRLTHATRHRGVGGAPAPTLPAPL